MANDRAITQSPRLQRLALYVASLLALPGNAWALRVDYQFDLSLLHSDNIALAAEDPVADTAVAPQLFFDARQSSSDLRLKARGQVQRIHYLRSSFPAEWRGGFAGQLDWTLLPERMALVVQDYFTREPVNLLNSLSPGNQQQVNVLVAGPDLFARLGPATRGEIELRYGNSHAGESPAFNGRRYSAAARVLHDINAFQRGSLNLEATRAEFDLSASYMLQSAYVGYSRDRPAFNLDVAVGSSRLSPDNPGASESIPLVRGSFDWKATPRSVLSARWRSGFSDAAEYLVAHGQDLDAPAASDLRLMDLAVQIGAGVFRERRAEMGYRFEGERFKLQARPYYEHVRYLDGITPEQRSRGAALELGYRLRPRTTLSLVADRQHRRFTEFSRDDEDFVASIGLVDRLTRHWSWRVDLQHRRRDSSDASQAYDENAAILAITYRR